MKKILITGAFGFVGTNLSAYLADKGYELWALDVEDSAPFGRLRTDNVCECESAKVEGAFAKEQSNKSCYARFYNWAQLDEILWNEVYAVVHLAGKAHDTKNTSDAQSYFDINTGLTKRVFEMFSLRGAEVQRGERKFILFSSVKAVADSVNGVLTEEAKPDPQTAYGQSKLEAERLLRPYSGRNGEGEDSRTHALAHPAVAGPARLANAGISTFILRPSMIHGPGNKGNLNLLYSIVRKRIPWPLGAYENQRSFASIENVCAVVKGLLCEDVESGVYQVADDDTISTNRLIELIAESQGRSAKIRRIPKSFILVLAKIGDILHLPLNSERLKKLTESYVVSNARVKKVLGWDKMPVSAEDGMRQTLKSFSRKGAKTQREGKNT